MEVPVFVRNSKYTLWSEKVFFSLVLLTGSVFLYRFCGSLKKVRMENNYLYISNYLKEIQIHISNIVNTDGPENSTLRRIVLILRSPSEFGSKIVFAPSFFDASEIANKLRNHLQLSK